MRRSSGKSSQKNQQVSLFRIRQIEFEEQLRFWPPAAAVIVKLNDLLQAGERTVVHEMRLPRSVAQAGSLECVAVCGIVGDGETPEVRIRVLAGEKPEAMKFAIGEVRAVVTLAARRLPNEQDQTSFLLVG